MKKLVLVLAAVLIATTASAQLVQSTTVTRVQKSNDSGMFLDLSVGSMSIKSEGVKVKLDGTAVGLSLGYRKVFTENVAWDVFSLNALSNTEEIGDLLYLQGITAIRGTTPVLFGDMTAFGSLGLGYGYFTEYDDGGLAFDMKIGINLTPKINVGFRYNSQKVEGGSFNVSAFNLGFKF